MYFSMKYFYKEKEIRNKNDWKKAFCSAYSGTSDDYHWKEGRSAERLAEDFMGKNAQGEETMVNMVKEIYKAKNVVLGKAEIERASKFDEYPRPRKQDLAIWGNADGKKIFICIEAKVDEAFGSKTISQQRKYVNGLKENNQPTEADKRLQGLVEDFLGGDEKNNGHLRYQLLYYLAGSFKDEKGDADIIFMPVIVYQPDFYSRQQVKKNHEAYCQFMKALGFDEQNSIEESIIQDIYYKKLTINNITKEVYCCYIVKKC